MATNIVTSSFRNLAASSVIESISTEPHYLFVGKHVAYQPDDQTISTPVETPQSLIATVYNEMAFGKRISNSDVISMVPRHDWATGTVFQQYVHDDPLLLTKPFYACVNAGAQYHVYKCLYNNGGANSTVQPTGQDLAPFTSPTDGYMWKYMYTYGSALHTKFATDDYLPVVANTEVTAGAVPGTIEVIRVTTTGSGYGNYYDSTFRAQDIQIGGDDLVYGLTEDASDLNYFYNSCILKLTSGSGANQYRTITNYIVESGQKKVTLESAFTTAPIATDSYQIYPAVTITGDGQETANCVAWAVINPNALNSVESIEILDPGVGYRVASATVKADATVGVAAAAVLSPIISPPSGHGSDIEEELGANRLCVSVRLTGTEANTIPVENDYRTIGIIREPLFANVHVSIDYSGQKGAFIANEQVLNYRDIRLIGSVTVSSTSAVVTGASTYFDDAVDVGDELIITDGVSNFYTSVTSKVNSTSIGVASNSTFSNSACSISIVKPLATATLETANSSVLVLENVDPNFKNNNLKILGTQSHATVSIDSGVSPNIKINGASVADFNTFIQLNKLGGALSGVTEFTQDETVTQTSSNTTASCFSFINDTVDSLYVSNVVGSFITGNNIVGNTSGAVFVPANKYPGALKVDSGKLVYLEAIAPVTRASNKFELLKVVLKI